MTSWRRFAHRAIMSFTLGKEKKTLCLIMMSEGASERRRMEWLAAGILKWMVSLSWVLIKNVLNCWLAFLYVHICYGVNIWTRGLVKNPDHIGTSVWAFRIKLLAQLMYTWFCFWLLLTAATKVPSMYYNMFDSTRHWKIQTTIYHSYPNNKEKKNSEACS